MHGCEIWTIKKVECQIIYILELWCWRRLLSPLNCKEIKPDSPKGNQHWLLTGRTDLKLQYFGHLMRRAKSLEKTLMLVKLVSRWGWVWQRIKRLTGGITVSMGTKLSKFQEIVKDMEAWCAVVHGVSKSWAWLWLQNINQGLIMKHLKCDTPHKHWMLINYCMYLKQDGWGSTCALAALKEQMCVLPQSR